MHEYAPRNKDGHCKRLVGGRKSGFRHCGQAEDTVQHVRYAIQLDEEEAMKAEGAYDLQAEAFHTCEIDPEA